MRAHLFNWFVLQMSCLLAAAFYAPHNRGPQIPSTNGVQIAAPGPRKATGVGPVVPSTSTDAGGTQGMATPEDICAFVGWVNAQKQLSNQHQMLRDKLVLLYPQKVNACSQAAPSFIPTFNTASAIEPQSDNGGLMASTFCAEETTDCAGTSAEQDGILDGLNSINSTAAANDTQTVEVDAEPGKITVKKSKRKRKRRAHRATRTSTVSQLITVLSTRTVVQPAVTLTSTQLSTVTVVKMTKEPARIQIVSKTVTRLAPSSQSNGSGAPTGVAKPIPTITASVIVNPVPTTAQTGTDAAPPNLPSKRTRGTGAGSPQSSANQAVGADNCSGDGPCSAPATNIDLEIIKLITKMIGVEASGSAKAPVNSKPAKASASAVEVTVTSTEVAKARTITVPAKNPSRKRAHSDRNSTADMGNDGNALAATRQTVTVKKVTQTTTTMAGSAPKSTIGASSTRPGQTVDDKALIPLLDTLADALVKQQINRTTAPQSQQTKSGQTSQSMMADLIRDFSADAPSGAAKHSAGKTRNEVDVDVDVSGSISGTGMRTFLVDRADGMAQSGNAGLASLWSNLKQMLTVRSKTGLTKKKSQKSEPSGGSTNKQLETAEAQEQTSTNVLLSALLDFINKNNRTDEDISNILEIIKTTKNNISSGAAPSYSQLATALPVSSIVSSVSASVAHQASSTDAAANPHIKWKTVTVVLENDKILDGYKKIIEEQDRQLHGQHSTAGHQSKEGAIPVSIGTVSALYPASSTNGSSTVSGSEQHTSSTSALQEVSISALSQVVPQRTTSTASIIAALPKHAILSISMQSSGAASSVSSASMAAILSNLSNTVAGTAAGSLASAVSTTVSQINDSAGNVRPLTAVSTTAPMSIASTVAAAATVSSGYAQASAAPSTATSALEAPNRTVSRLVSTQIVTATTTVTFTTTDQPPAASTVTVTQSASAPADAKRKIRSAALKLEDRRGDKPKTIEISLPIDEFQNIVDRFETNKG
ncbi:hypothetical protein PAPHI01_1249 [Pancytospora philotis]|nr:hypothetical protein PAPHI01_1249 [Pancytospora philotis]